LLILLIQRLGNVQSVDSIVQITSNRALFKQKFGINAFVSMRVDYCV